MAAGPGTKIDRERLIVGDGLRAAAALSVLVYHCVQWLGNERYDTILAPHFGLPAAHVFKALIFGVAVFFVLSGYLVFRGFARALVLGTRAPSTPRYAAHRLLRIVPAFWLAVTLTILIEGTRHSGFDGVLAVYGFAQIYVLRPIFSILPQMWTLNVEIVFYLALPILAWLAARVTRRIGEPVHRAAFLLAALLVLSLASAAWIVGTDPLPWEGLPPVYLIAFGPGMAAAILEPVVAHRVPTWLGRFGAPLLLLIALGLFVELTLIQPLVVGWRTTVAALSAGAILWAALLRQWALGKGWRVLDNSPMRWLGERSYGIYLFHFLVIVEVWPLVKGVHGAWITLTCLVAVALIGTAVLAALSWRFVEAPLMRLGRAPRLAVDLEPDPRAGRVDHAPA